MFLLRSVLFQTSPTAQMYIRDGKITPPDIIRSYENRDKVINMPCYGSAQAYEITADLRKGEFECEFDIYPFASNPKLVERNADPFAEFIEGLDIGS